MSYVKDLQLSQESAQPGFDSTVNALTYVPNTGLHSCVSPSIDFQHQPVQLTNAKLPVSFSSIKTSQGSLSKSDVSDPLNVKTTMHDTSCDVVSQASTAAQLYVEYAMGIEGGTGNACTSDIWRHAHQYYMHYFTWLHHQLNQSSILPSLPVTAVLAPPPPASVSSDAEGTPRSVRQTSFGAVSNCSSVQASPPHERTDVPPSPPSNMLAVRSLEASHTGKCGLASRGIGELECYPSTVSNPGSRKVDYGSSTSTFSSLPQRTPERKYIGACSDEFSKEGSIFCTPCGSSLLLSRVGLVSPVLRSPCANEGSRSISGYMGSPAATPLPRDNKKDWYEMHERFVKVSSYSKSQVCLIGDSIINGLARYSAVWSKYFRTFDALNFGIGGDRTQHVLWRAENGEIPRHCKYVVVHCGTNNIDRSKAKDIADGIVSVGATFSCALPHVKVLITGLLPRDLQWSFRRDKILDTNQYLRALCMRKGMENFYFVEPDGAFCMKDGNLNKDLYYQDYLHLSEKGNEAFAHSIHDLLMKIAGDDSVSSSLGSSYDGSSSNVAAPSLSRKRRLEEVECNAKKKAKSAGLANPTCTFEASDNCAAVTSSGICKMSPAQTLNKSSLSNALNAIARCYDSDESTNSD